MSSVDTNGDTPHVYSQSEIEMRAMVSLMEAYFARKEAAARWRRRRRIRRIVAVMILLGVVVAVAYLR